MSPAKEQWELFVSDTLWPLVEENAFYQTVLHISDAVKECMDEEHPSEHLAKLQDTIDTQSDACKARYETVLNEVHTVHSPFFTTIAHSILHSRGSIHILTNGYVSHVLSAVEKHESIPDFNAHKLFEESRWTEDAMKQYWTQAITRQVENYHRQLKDGISYSGFAHSMKQLRSTSSTVSVEPWVEKVVEYQTEPIFSPALLTELVQGLVYNAVRAVEQAGRTDPVFVTVDRSDDDQLLVRIEDGGPGIQDSIQKRLFTERISESETGGRWCYVCGNMIRRIYGGTIEITDTSENGTTIEIRIPLGKELPKDFEDGLVI